MGAAKSRLSGTTAGVQLNLCRCKEHGGSGADEMRLVTSERRRQLLSPNVERHNSCSMDLRRTADEVETPNVSDEAWPNRGGMMKFQICVDLQANVTS